MIRETPRALTTQDLQIPGFEILQLIGKGGMGEVYLARQQNLGRLVAIKLMSTTDLADIEARLARFRREAALMASVSHPNVLSVFDFGEVDGRPYLVMEYVEGGDLRRLMRPGKPMAVPEVLAILHPVGEALECLHRQGVLHRDLKPENILMHHGDNPKVADFGVAVLRAAIGSITQTNEGMGTIGYVAPEQQYRLRVDERADQFSITALAYELLTGERPLGLFRKPSTLNPKLSPKVDDVLMQGMAEDPQDRFGSIRDFLEKLSLALKPSQSPRPRRLWTGLGTALLSCFLLLGFMGVQGNKENNKPDSSNDQDPIEVHSATEQAAVPNSETLTNSQEYHDGSPLEKLARQIWIERGRPEGRDEENWEEAHRRFRAQQLNLPIDQENSIGMKLIFLPSGEYLRGSPESDDLAFADEQPQHLVRISSHFYMAAHEVTVGQFREFVEETAYLTEAEREGNGSVWDTQSQQVIICSEFHWRNPGYPDPQQKDEPVVQISPEDAKVFCTWLSQKEGRTYRLPTEAEWEFACRAGTQTRWSFGDDPDRLDEYAWHRGNTYGQLQAVGQKKPNNFGLFDMHGNAWEYCSDGYAPYPESAPEGPLEDPEVPADKGPWLRRGGSWDNANNLPHSRSASRDFSWRPYYTSGFRVCLSIDQTP